MFPYSVLLVLSAGSSEDSGLDGVLISVGWLMENQFVSEDAQ